MLHRHQRPAIRPSLQHTASCLHTPAASSGVLAPGARARGRKGRGARAAPPCPAARRTLPQRLRRARHQRGAGRASRAERWRQRYRQPKQVCCRPQDAVSAAKCMQAAAGRAWGGHSGAHWVRAGRAGCAAAAEVGVGANRARAAALRSRARTQAPEAPPAEARRQAPAAEAQHKIRADYAKPAAVRVQAAAREEAVGQGTARMASREPPLCLPRGALCPPPGRPGSPSEPCSAEKKREGASAGGQRRHAGQHAKARGVSPTGDPVVLSAVPKLTPPPASMLTPYLFVAGRQGGQAAEASLENGASPCPCWPMAGSISVCAGCAWAADLLLVPYTGALAVCRRQQMGSLPRRARPGGRGLAQPGRRQAAAQEEAVCVCADHAGCTAGIALPAH